MLIFLPFLSFGLLNSLLLSNQNKINMGKQRLSDTSQRKGFSRSSSSANIAPIVFLSVVALVLAIAVALALRQYFEARELAVATAVERNECQARADSLLVQLNQLDAAFQSLSREHSELENLANQQRIEINRLKGQILQFVGNQTIDEVKAHVEQLETQLAEYQEKAQILSDENTKLSSENDRVKNTLASTEEQVIELELKNKSLSDQIASASGLRIMNVEVITTRSARSGERETDRARRVEKIEVCFTILENILSSPGSRNFYLRITGPNGELLSNGHPETFKLIESQVPYSASKAFDYKNQQMVACISFVPRDPINKGIYRVTIYGENRELGTQLFELK